MKGGETDEWLIVCGYYVGGEGGVELGVGGYYGFLDGDHHHHHDDDDHDIVQMNWNYLSQIHFCVIWHLVTPIGGEGEGGIVRRRAKKGILILVVLDVEGFGSFLGCSFALVFALLCSTVCICTHQQDLLCSFKVFLLTAPCINGGLL